MTGAKSMIWALMAAAVVAAFFGGYALGGIDSVSHDEMQAMIAELRADIPAETVVERNPPSRLIISLDDDPVKGNPDARITLVEFSDFQCPFCSRFYSQTLPMIESQYIDTGLVKMVYRDMPLGFHGNAVPAHIAAECADQQGSFWEYHDVLFERQQQWESLDAESLRQTLVSFADELGLDSGFDSCLDSPDIASEVQQDYMQASSYGATGTPTFFVGNADIGFVKITGAQPFESFQAVFERQLNT